MLRLLETHPAATVERALTTARAAFAAAGDRAAVLRQQQTGRPPACPPVAGVRPELARITVPAPTLSAYDALVEGTR